MSSRTRDDLSAIPTTVGATSLWHLGGAWSVEDATRYSPIKCRLFAQVMRTYLKVLYTQQARESTPIGGHYPSDLYHGATEIHDMVLTGDQAFVVEVDAWGMFLFQPQANGSFPDGYRETRFMCHLYATGEYEAKDWYLEMTCTKWQVGEATA